MGTTIPEIDTVLAPYVKKSYDKYIEEYRNIVKEVDGVFDEIKADQFAEKKVRRDLQQGFQGLEYSMNTISSSRGDFSFTSAVFGADTSRWAIMVAEEILNVRIGGQGKEGHKQPLLFPKLIFTYDSNLHGPGKELEHLFLKSVKVSTRCSYPDYFSLEPGTPVGENYREYGTKIVPMGLYSPAA